MDASSPKALLVTRLDASKFEIFLTMIFLDIIALVSAARVTVITSNRLVGRVPMAIVTA